MRGVVFFAAIGLAASLALTALPARAMEPLEYVQALITGEEKDKAAIAAFPETRRSEFLRRAPPGNFVLPGIKYGKPIITYRSERRLYVSLPYQIEALPFGQELYFGFKKLEQQWARRSPIVGDEVHGLFGQASMIQAILALPDTKVVELVKALNPQLSVTDIDPDVFRKNTRRRYESDAIIVNAFFADRKNFDELAIWTKRFKVIELEARNPQVSLDANYELPAGGGREFQDAISKARQLSIFQIESHTGLLFTLEPTASFGSSEPYRILWLTDGLSADEVENHLSRWEDDRNMTGIRDLGEGWLLLHFN